MANGYVKGVVPADLDPDALNMYVAGEIVIDQAAVDHDGKLTPTLYVAAINPDSRKKELFLVSGAGKYELLEHLTRAHVIGRTTPTNFDRSTLWFNTEMVYVEPSDVTKSYITIRTETSPGVWEWKKILPYTTMDTVILGKNNAGNPITLASLIKNNRVVNPLPQDVRESSYGELYINDSNELYYKMGPNPSDQHLVGTVSTYLRERLIEQIKVGNEQPLNFNYNSVWFTDDGDISLSRSKYINLVDPNKSTGLKFVRDAQNKMKSGAVLENEAKSVIIDNNNTTDYGHIWLNYPVNEDGKYYIELSIEDPHNAAQLMFLGNGVQQPVLNDYGTQSDNSQALIDTKKMVFGGNNRPKAFVMHKKTIFIELDKTGGNTNICLGYVTDSGTKEYVYGDGTTTVGLSMNLARIAVGSSASTEANSHTRFSVLPYLIKKIPEGFKGINNTLPGENPFSAVVLATNAESVFLAKNVKLADQVEAGRIIPVFRDYADRSNARINEIIFDSNSSKLYTKQRNGRVVPIAGALDDSIEDHILNSLKVTMDDVKTFTKLASDPRRIYVSKKASLPADPDVIIEGNMAVVDNSSESDDSTYKVVIPRSLSRLIGHNWVDNQNRPVTGDLKTYLDEIDKLIKNSILTDNVYSGYGELNFKTSDLVNTYNTKQSFIQELSKRMIDNSLYIETVAKKPAGGVSSNQIDNFFSVPDDGILYAYCDSKDNLYATLYTRNATYTNAYMKPSYNGGEWKKVITEVNGVTNVNDVISTGKFEVEKTIESQKNIFSPIYTLKGSTGNIGIEANTITNNKANLLSYDGSSLLDTLTYKLGDKKFKSSYIVSKDRPIWIDEHDNEYAWLTLNDIRNAWNYKGSLFNAGTFTSLDSLVGATSGGYYTLGETSTTGNGFPKVGLTGILENFVVPGEPIFQTFVGKDNDDNHRIYVRSKKNNTWLPWNILPNEKDLDKKLDKVGGTVTGALTIEGDIKGRTMTLTDRLTTNKIESINKYNLITSSVTGGNNTYTIGDTNYKTVIIANDGTSRPQYYNGSKYQNFIVDDDINALKLSLNNDYYTKIQTDSLLGTKVDGTRYEEEMKNKVSRSGDNVTGTITMDAGDIVIKKGSLTLDGNSKVSLAGKKYNDNITLNNEPVSTYTGTMRYDVVGLGSNNEQAIFTVSSGNNIQVNTNTPTSIQFFLDKNGNLAVGNIINKAVKNNARTVLMKDEIVDNYTGGATKVLSAERGKELSESTIGRERGNLFDTIGVTSTYSTTNLTSLHAGYYYITTLNEIKALNLDTNIVTSTTGILFVEGSINSANRSYRFVTRTNNTDKYVMANLVLNNNTGEWKYMYDISRYYTREEIDALLARLKDEIVGLFKSKKFSFTGNTINNSIPEKLCHTHNHENLGNTDNIFFKTNITAESTTNTKNFVIRLSGFSMGSAMNDTSSPISIMLTGKLDFQSNAPVLSNVNIVNMVPGSSLEIFGVKLTNDGFLTYGVKDKVTNRQLSFDTYMRFSSIEDTTFDGAITLYRTTEF